MSLSNKETDLFDALRDGAVENFMLIEVNGRPIICADHSEEQDGSEIEPLYGRLSAAEAEKVMKALSDGEDETRKPRSRPEKRWRG